MMNLRNIEVEISTFHLNIDFGKVSRDISKSSDLEESLFCPFIHLQLASSYEVFAVESNYFLWCAQHPLKLILSGFVDKCSYPQNIGGMFHKVLM